MTRAHTNIETLVRAAVLVDGHALTCRAAGSPTTFLPGGHVEPGESLAAALRREIVEEIDLADPRSIRVGAHVGIVEHAWADEAGRPRFEVNHVLRVDVDGLDPRAPPAAREPALSFAWIMLADLDDAALLPRPMRPLLRLVGAGWREPFAESTLPDAVDRSRVVVRGVRDDDVERLRAARLYSLAETPTAFGSTLVKEMALSMERWRERAAATAHDDGSFTVVAVDDGVVRGMATGVVEGDGDARHAHLMAMWVHSGLRGSGVAASLLDAVVDWAGRVVVRSIYLWVTSTNERARRFYARMGFVASGETQALPWKPSILEQRMVRALP